MFATRRASLWIRFFEQLRAIDVPDDFMTERPMNAPREEDGVFDDELPLHTRVGGQ
ncbi:hypothetical protein [Chitinimonas arctica]|uniref:hypothetical protein n=1 Tax=Chitinimonas arctica TaxID=2594795 RepID=UPI0015D34A97|nr:hypothetical protein [Chitinimonas arctica]